jgi:hypothetical protein
MAWEWVAPASGAALGLAGLAGGWLTAATGRRHEREMADLRHRHDQAVEEATWRRGRRTDAYLAMLDVVSATGVWLRSWRPESIPDREDLPGWEVTRPAWAAMTAFASEEAWDAANAWSQVSGAAVAESGRVVPEDSTTWSRFDELRDDEQERRIGFADCVAVELGGRRVGRPPERR